MTPPAGLPSNYRFADLTLDVARRCVTRHSALIELKALDFDLLRFLVEQAPNVVNAEVLAEKVWGRHFVSPENVAQRVMLLRQSLSDDATKPRYIETVRNKGYRLIPVVEIAPLQAPTAALERSRWPISAATALVLLGIAAFFAYRLGGTVEQPAPNPGVVAVLPFENHSPDPADDYFAAGMQDEIVNQLNKIHELRVIPMPRVAEARLSPNLLRDLSAGTELGGSVYYAEERVRVMLRLTQTATGELLWSSSYDRELSDIFAIQSEIALEVARALRLKLSDSEREHIERVPTVDPRARDLYLKARVWQSRTTREELLLAIADIEEALKIDEKFTEAWIIDANARNIAQIFDSKNAAEHRARGLYAARRAVELDAGSGSAHAALGLSSLLMRDWKGAETAFRKAVSLDVPPDASSYCMLQLAAAKYDAARELMEEGRDLQPQNSTGHRFAMFTYAALDQWDRATELYESGTELFNPWREAANTWIHLLLGRGQREAALAITPTDAFNAEMLASLDRPKEAVDKLHQAYDASGPGDPNRRLYIGLWAGYFGDPSLALEAMRATIAEQGAQMVYIWLPQLAQMRQLPAFKAYMREVGIVDYWKEYGFPDICREVGKDDFECH
jgi:TolB-like protein/DNA-binding winged helix-turn-helix (wHTH) protein